MQPTKASSGYGPRFSVGRTRPQDLNLSRSEVDVLKDVDLVLRPEEVGVDELRAQASRYRAQTAGYGGLLPPPPSRTRSAGGISRGLDRARGDLKALTEQAGALGEAAAFLLEASRDYERMLMSVESGRARVRE
ncbi:MAG: hypothetical protein AAFZ18_03180 [Myxococcota bacterium]